MKQAADKFTTELFDSPRRGRPRKVRPKTAAERMREWRARKKAASISVTRDENIRVLEGDIAAALSAQATGDGSALALALPVAEAAALGIYGENAVTSPKRGDRE